MAPVLLLVGVYQAATEVSQRMDVADAIVRAVGPESTAFLHRHCPKDQVEPLLNDILIAIALGLDRVRGKDEKQFWRWCYQIARNKLADLHEGINADPTLPFDPKDLAETIEASATHTPLSAGERLDLEYALDLLRAAKPPCVGYLWDHYILGLDYTELGHLYGLSPDAMRMQVKRCLVLANELLTHPAHA